MFAPLFRNRALSFAVCAGVLLFAACDSDELAGPPEAAMLSSTAVNAAMGKTDVCHRTTSGDFNKISVADAAYDTHIEHGDGGIGDPVPGMEGYAFDDDCTPVEVEVALEIVPATITVGAMHTCGLDLNGNAYCWGRNLNGELGNGTMTNSSTPVAVTMPIGESFAAITAGESHTVALTVAGSAYAWGSNFGGLLGDGTTTDRTTPVPVSMPTGESFAAIAAGEYHTVALTTTGAAYGWGFNWYGQLGDGTTTNSGTPVAVAMPTGETFTAISAGREHSVALTAAGVAYGWGANWDGQLGDGTMTSRYTPVPASMPAGESFTAISAGYEHTVALTAGGTAYAWGHAGTGADSPTPVAIPMPPGETFAAISAGSIYTLALTAAGIAYAWGLNSNGQLGDGTTTQRTTPVTVDTQETFAAISAGIGRLRSEFSVAITTAGAAYAWGGNEHGLGDGTTRRSTTPVPVSGGITFAH